MKNIKRIILINLLIILLSILFSNASFARDLSGISDLRSSHNVGNEIYVKTGGADDTGGAESLEMSDERDHIYCIQHLANSDDGWMTVDEYMEIRGNQATAYWNYGNSNRTIYSKYNIALGYLLGQEGWRKGYSMNNDVKTRQQAIHHLLTHDWGIYVNGNSGLYGNNGLATGGSQTLLWNKWFDEWHTDRSDSKSFLARANAEANNENAHCATNAKINSTTVASSASEAQVTGPYYLTYSGSISWVCPIDQYGNWMGGYYDNNRTWHYDTTIKYYSDAACTQEIGMTGIKSGGPFFIKNTSGKEMKKIQLKNTAGEDSWIQTEIRTVETTSNVIGPIRIEYTGIIDWICPINENNSWVSGYEYVNGKWRYKSNIAFYKDAACTQAIEMTDIPSNTDFYIKNTSGQKIKNINFKLKNNRVYCANIWFLERSDGQAAQRLISATTKTDNYVSTIILNVKLKTGKLTINKKDSLGGKKITSPAKFKIKTSKGNWLIGTNGQYNYDNSNEAQATVYTTNNGTITLENLLNDTYQIYEVESPKGYQLSKQAGYNANKKYVDFGTVKLDGDTEKDIYNDLIISIDGYVWTEGRPDKPSDETYDSVYIENTDHRVANVTVRLMRKDGKNENPLTVTTNGNGYYKFENAIKKKEIDDYYIEFDYRDGKYSYTLNGKTINKTIKDSNGHIKYIPVGFKNVVNGSKALAETIPTNDANVPGVANTYKENNNEGVNIYGLSKIGTMDDANLILKNINLGIKELLEPEFSIVKNIADVDIAINNYNYKYIYGGRDPKEEGFAENTREGPAVKWQNSNVNHAYSRPVYPSDVIYKNSDEKNKELDVKVTYRIDITNTTTYKVKELYVENKLILESILDDFDTNRYTLLDTNWDANNGTASMKSEYLEKIQKEINENKEKGLMSEATATAYITFSVNKNAIIDILNHPEGIIENNPTKVIVKGYHLYNRDDYMWNNLKTNSGQIKVNKEHQTESQTQAAEAPYLVFTIKPDGIIERTVSGKVFKDNVTVERGNSGEVVGDGKHQDTEKGIEGVKVELLGEDEDMKVTKLYQLYTENNVDKTRVIDAVVTTNQNGEYSLNGVVPGKYYLRFTYGNGTYKITDLTGTTIKEGTFETKVGENTIAAKDYKSTIMNSEIVSMIENKAELWYKEDGFKEGKYSLALDNLEQRRNLNEAEANKELNDSEKIKEISADTSKISVTIENTKKDEAEETEETTNKQISATNSSGEQIKMLLNNQKKNIKFEFGGFYFGLIEMPKQELKIEKLIKNILIKNGQTNVFYNGNPEEVAKQGAGVVTVTDLDNAENGGSTYARAEMVEASISGSDFRIAYEVKITNVSDVNYYNEEYYKFGIIDKTKEVTATPITVYDYLDDTFKYEPEPLDPEKYYEKYKSDKDRIEEIDPNKKETIIVNGEKVEVQAYKLKGGSNQDKWITLYTNKIKNRDSNHPTSDSVIIVASKLLSSSEYDWVVYNRAEIIDAKLSPSSLDTVNSDSEKERLLKTAAKEIHSNGMVEAMFTLTIPTGEDRYSTTLYAIAGIIALIVLSTGIVIIKKKIL